MFQLKQKTAGYQLTWTIACRTPPNCRNIAHAVFLSRHPNSMQLRIVQKCGFWFYTSMIMGHYRIKISSWFRWSAHAYYRCANANIKIERIHTLRNHHHDCAIPMWINENGPNICACLLLNMTGCNDCGHFHVSSCYRHEHIHVNVCDQTHPLLTKHQQMCIHAHFISFHLHTAQPQGVWQPFLSKLQEGTNKKHALLVQGGNCCFSSQIFWSLLRKIRFLGSQFWLVSFCVVNILKILDNHRDRHVKTLPILPTTTKYIPPLNTILGNVIRNAQQVSIQHIHMHNKHTKNLPCQPPTSSDCNFKIKSNDCWIMWSQKSVE